MCMMDDGDGMVTIIRDEERTARKLHRCNECTRPIVRGETYRFEYFAFDGDRSTHKTCEHCQVLRSWLQAECGGMLYGDVQADFLEHIYEGPRAMDMLRVGVMARRRWWLRPRGGLYPVPTRPKTTHEHVLDLGPPLPRRLRRDY